MENKYTGIIFGYLFIFVPIVSILIRMYYRFFAQKAEGYIVGYGHETVGARGIRLRAYRVQYEYKGQEYLADSIETKTMPGYDWKDPMFHTVVTVKFNPKNPSAVSIVQLQRRWLEWYELMFLILGLCCVYLGKIL